MSNVEYENMLYLLMFLTLLIGSGLTLRKSKVPPIGQDIDQKVAVKNPDPNGVDLGPINKRLDELSEKVSDIHMSMEFLKKVKEKNGENS